MANKEELLELEGVVTESLKSLFRVETNNLDKNGVKHQVLATLGGKLRKNYIKIVPGDRVKVEVSPYDISRGRITFRMK